MSATSNPAIEPLKGGALWLAASILALANFIAVLNMTITNVAVPTIAGSIGIASSQGTWIITSYAVAEAITVPLTGWLSARFGAVRVFTTSMMLFGMSSILCGLSNSLGMLVAFRILQGLCGGPMMPLTQTLLLRIFPREKAPAAIAMWSMTTLIAPIMGPIVGGYMCDNASWGWVFFVNVPIALIGSRIGWNLLKRYQNDPQRSPIDFIGLGLLILWVGALQIMLDEGKDHDWFASTEICLLAVTAVVGFLAFLIWELTEKHPIVDLRVFRHRGYTMALVTLVLGFGGYFGIGVLTPLWLQRYMGYTATWSGMTTAWSGVFAVMVAPFAAKLSARVDARRLVFFGLSWLALMTFIRSFGFTDMTYWQIALPLLFMGFGMPFFFVPLNSIALSSVNPEETASAAGLMSFLRTLGGAIATSVVNTSWENRMRLNHADLAGQIDPTGEATRSLLETGMGMDGVRNTLDRLLEVQSVMLSTNQLFFVIAIVLFISGCTIWLAPRSSRVTNAGGAH